MALFTSCLESGLEDIEDSDLCALSSITMEYRWLGQNGNGYDMLQRQQLTLSKNSPDESGTIHMTVTVPPASAAFPVTVRKSVTMEGLYLTSVISAAAKIAPLNGAPEMGKPATFEEGKEYQYVVTAANGKTAVYTIVIDEFINFESGTFSTSFTCRDVVYFTGTANPCDYTSEDANKGNIGEMGKNPDYKGSADAKSFALWDSSSGDMTIFKVNLTDKARYVVSANSATNQSGVSANVEISRDLEALKIAALNPDHTLSVVNNGKWNDFSNKLEFTGYAINEPGTYYVRVVLQNERGTGSTACLKFIKLYN